MVVSNREPRIYNKPVVEVEGSVVVEVISVVDVDASVVVDVTSVVDVEGSVVVEVTSKN